MHWLFHTHRNMALTILRVMLGAVFFPHGAQKTLGWYGGPGFPMTMYFFEQQGIPTVFALLAIAAEFFGALGLLLGFLTRVAAFGICVNIAIAAALMLKGAGAFSVDRAIDARAHEGPRARR